SSSDATVGRDEAARIRQVATIATLMLKGDDTILKEDLASKRNGVPLHARVSNAQALGSAMADLATRELVDAMVVLGDVAIDIDYESLDFALPKFSVNKAAWIDGFPVMLETTDSL